MAPHTSNWDFIIGMAARSILQLNTHFLGKKELFRFPLGIFFRQWGGLPVDRSQSGQMVEKIIDLFNQHDEFSICIAPEGTRKKTQKLKTGFYHIAYQLGIPIIMVGLDYPSKAIHIHPPFYPCGNLEKDLTFILDFFRPFRGRYPHQGID